MKAQRFGVGGVKRVVHGDDHHAVFHIQWQRTAFARYVVGDARCGVELRHESIQIDKRNAEFFSQRLFQALLVNHAGIYENLTQRGFAVTTLLLECRVELFLGDVVHLQQRFAQTHHGHVLLPF